MSERDGEDEKEEENKRTDPRVGHIMNYTLKSFKVSTIGIMVMEAIFGKASALGVVGFPIINGCYCHGQKANLACFVIDFPNMTT